MNDVSYKIDSETATLDQLMARAADYGNDSVDVNSAIQTIRSQGHLVTVNNGPEQLEIPFPTETDPHAPIETEELTKGDGSEPAPLPTTDPVKEDDASLDTSLETSTETEVVPEGESPAETDTVVEGLPEEITPAETTSEVVSNEEAAKQE